MRGKPFSLPYRSDKKGITPRMRGKQNRRTVWVTIERIPPCVGKTVVAPPFFNRGENHPHACSEIPQLFYVLSLSYYLSEISDSISTSVFSMFKTKQKVIQVNRRESTHEMTGVEPVSKYRKTAHIREFMLRV